MHTLPVYSIVVIFLILTLNFTLLSADRDTVIFTISEDSEVYYTADVRIALVSTSTVKGINTNVNGIIKWVETESRPIIKADITINASQFDSGNTSRDSDVRDILNVEEYPEITFELISLLGIEAKPLEEISGDFVATGSLSVHGTTKEISVPVSLHYTGGMLTVKGSTVAKYTDFGIDPPRVAGFVGRAPDELRLHVNITAQRAE